MDPLGQGLWPGRQRTPQDAAKEARQPASDQGVHSNWPGLYALFQQHALTQWVVAWQRHREVSPNEVLVLQRLSLQATTADMQSQIDSWRAEGSTVQLIEWLVSGPWKTPEIEQAVHFGQLKELLFLPFDPVSLGASTPRSAYEGHAATPDDNAIGPLRIMTDHAWITSPAPPLTAPPEPPRHRVWVALQDAMGRRQIVLEGHVFILGQPKTLTRTDGRQIELADGQTIDWLGEQAQFVAVHGQHVSGMHLALRRHEKGFDYQDLDSANGTFEGSQAILPSTWHAASEGQSLCLGGPVADLAEQAPRVRIQCSAIDVSLQSLHPTPLRPSTSAPPASVSPEVQASPLVIRLEGSNGWRLDVPVRALPLSIGRDVRCEAVIPAVFSKVSRRHLVIGEWDADRQSLWIEDTSTHGVLIQKGRVSGDPKQGAWVDLASQLVLGASQHAPSVTLSFVSEPSGS